ncbi:MAG: glycosyltransferase family 2 protein [Cyanobium sp.]
MKRDKDEKELTLAAPTQDEDSVALQISRGNACWQKHDWQGAIRAYAYTLWREPLASMSMVYLIEASRDEYQRERSRYLRDHEDTIVIRAIHGERIMQEVVVLGESTERQNPLLVVPEDQADLVSWCWLEALRRPSDCIILEGQSMALVIVGLIYKLIWGAVVLVDDLPAAGSENKKLESLTVDQLKIQANGLPNPRDLQGDEWQRLAAGLITGFDGTLTSGSGKQDNHSFMQRERKVVNGAQLNCLEALSPALASPLMASRFWRWNQEHINWPELRNRTRETDLVSIVIPAYGHPNELEACLKALRSAQNQTRWEAVIVMNDSTSQNGDVVLKHSCEDPRIRAVWPGENLQFALGCNLGFAASNGHWLVLLNNDCQVTRGWLDALIYPLEDEIVAATQPRLVGGDGSVRSLGVVFHSEQTLGYPLYAGLPATLPCVRKPHQLQALTGACLAMRAGDFARIDGLDCRYINSQEDIDLCLRLLELPERRYCLSCPDSEVIHGEGRSPGRYSHSAWSRHQFVRRWTKRIRPDDTSIYAEDEISFASFRPDKKEYGQAGIGAGRAVLQY